jgi:hypothetical protein
LQGLVLTRVALGTERLRHSAGRATRDLIQATSTDSYTNC